MTKKITLIQSNGKVTDAIVRATHGDTGGTWYYVCVRRVEEMANEGHPLFKEAWQMIQKINRE